MSEPNSSHTEHVSEQALPPWLFFLAALALAVPFAYFSDVPERDVANRYAAMAEAIAAKHWIYAFHPRVPILHPLLSGGLVWLFGVSGFAAARMVSVICFAAGVFPLNGIMKRMFGKNVSLGVMMLYLFSPFLLRLASVGLRDSAKCLLILAMAHAIFLIREKSTSWRGYLYLGAMAGLSMLTRSELILYGGLILGGAILFESMASKFPVRSLTGAYLTSAMLCVPVLIHHALFEMPTPEARFITLYERLTGAAPSLTEALLIAAAAPLTAALLIFAAAFIVRASRIRLSWILAAVSVLGFAAVLTIIVRQAVRTPENAAEIWLTLYRAFDPAWAVLAAAGLVLRLRRKLFCSADWLLIAMIAVHDLLVIAQIVFYDGTLLVSTRYLVTVSPLGFGWSIYGLYAVGTVLAARWPQRFGRKAAAGFILFAVFGLLFHTLGPILKDYFEPKHKAVRLGAFRLAELYRIHEPETHCTIPPPFDLTTYENDAVPGVYFAEYKKYCVSAYLAGGRQVYNPVNADFYVSEPHAKDVEPPRPDDSWEPLSETVLMGRDVYCTVFRRANAKEKHQ